MVRRGPSFASRGSFLPRALTTRVRGAQSDDDLPRPDEIEVEFQDLYRHDEEQAYVTLMSQDIKSINFPCEENYTVRLCVRACPKRHDAHTGSRQRGAPWDAQTDQPGTFPR